MSQDVFISIQAFPALLDVAESCDVAAVSCGSRHTAAVTSKTLLCVPLTLPLDIQKLICHLETDILAIRPKTNISNYILYI